MNTKIESNTTDKKKHQKVKQNKYPKTKARKKNRPKKRINKPM
jgi:hypothetical protein